jgi:cyclophilin family peptidyl-prolyl cis-trans isomerase
MGLFISGFGTFRCGCWDPPFSRIPRICSFFCHGLLCRTCWAVCYTVCAVRFGPGPHRVGVVVQFDPAFPKLAETDENTATIVLELASVEELPHVVYWFLEQVSRGLYDGCSFFRNAGHVIQGGLVPNFLSPPNPRLHQRFKDAGFYAALFQEYSERFPHVKYTMGLAGRPGGPDFYISVRDNSALHGPGGQKNYEDPTEADPCFAKVVEGFDVVDRMHISPVLPGGYNMVNNVAITSMTILSADSINAQDMGGGHVSEAV